MADIHLNTTGSNTAPYDTWAKAATTPATAVGAMAAGDRLLIDSTYATITAGIALTFPGTPANPNQILSCIPTGSSGPASLSVGARLASSTSSCSFSGSVYAYGVTFDYLSASSGPISVTASSGSTQTFEACAIQNTGGGGSSSISFGSGGGSDGTYTELINTTLKTSTGGMFVAISGTMEVRGGGFSAGTSSPTTMIAVGNGGRSGTLRMTGFDFSNLAAGTNLINYATGGCTAFLNDCKLPASYTGLLLVSTALPGMRSEFYNMDDGNTNYRFAIYDYVGTARESTTVYLTGATFDGTALSDKMTTTANVKYPQCFRSRWLYIYDAGGGSARTASVECARDGSATPYTDAEAWLEVECLGDAASVKSVMSSGKAASVLATPANVAASAAAWTGLGGTNNKMLLSAAYTPQKAGYVRARVCFAAPSGTLYYNPSLTIT